MGLGVDENTRLPPRTRKAPTLAAQPGIPGRVAHAYSRQGALNLFAGVDTRGGTVYAPTAARKRQVECLTCLAHLDRAMVPTLTTRPMVLDKVRMHKGPQVHTGLTKHPRCVGHLPPVHGAWMNQGEQGCAMVQRKRLQSADCADKHHLAERLLAFVTAWHEQAHPFQWSTKSVAQVMAKCDRPRAKAA